MTLPNFSSFPHFVDNLIAAFGHAATEKWIARLPSLLADAASRWDLELGPAADGLSYNYVCSAKRLPSPAGGGPGVGFKIAF